MPICLQKTSKPTARGFRRDLRRDGQDGFTLIEILVVMFIISIMTGLVVANMAQSNDNAELDEEAKRIKLLLQLARDEAMVTSTEYGFKPEENAYSFYLYDELTEKWVLNEEKPFQLRELPETISLELDIDGEPLIIEATDESNSKRKQPDVLILSSGESTPFELLISASDEDFYRLKTDGYGPFEWLEDEK